MTLVVITGGARCGKSAIAEQLAYRRYQKGSQVAVAVFGNPEGDDVEFAERIKHHKADRPREFRTIEAFDRNDWLGEVSDDELLVVDCLGTALSAVMAHEGDGESMSDRIDSAPGQTVERDFQAILERLVSRSGDTIVVTNESGCGLVPEFESGRIYRDIICRANRFVIAHADSAYLCVCGRLIELDSLPTEIAWPVD